MGVPLMRTKTLAYADRRVLRRRRGLPLRVPGGVRPSPTTFNLQISIFVLCMVILGGMGNVWGVVLGGVVLAYVNYQGLFAIGHTFNSMTVGADIDMLGVLSFLIFGVDRS